MCCEDTILPSVMEPGDRVRIRASLRQSKAQSFDPAIEPRLRQSKAPSSDRATKPRLPQSQAPSLDRATEYRVHIWTSLRQRKAHSFNRAIEPRLQQSKAQSSDRATKLRLRQSEKPSVECELTRPGLATSNSGPVSLSAVEIPPVRN